MAGSTPASPRARPARPGRPRWLGRLLAGLLALLVLLTLVGAWHGSQAVDGIDFRARLQPPGLAHPLGTDEMGRDLLARALRGGAISLAIGAAAMLLSALVGTAVGVLAGSSRHGRLDALLMTTTDLFLALPQLPLLLLVVHLFRDALQARLGPTAGLFVLIVAVIGGLRWMSVARLVRAQVLAVRQREFVDAALALGASRTWVARHHLLPHAWGTVAVTSSLDAAAAILTESTLSFLGLGFPPETPTWGRMLHDGKDYLEIAPWVAAVPGLAIALTVLLLHGLGDAWRDALDPHRRTA
ncbi:ABC transporter permease [Leptothrix discophora]|uniref:ABC transporter permease n=1 Tax=Leptothrix discophora TaxID=89 RepID=A0ABT9G3N1_LEPDI|nr:ABC transporter permease [Leptothrix discophora]MDP4301086.1 ABC transporter permease [Leptothrix discophora]